MPGRYHSVRKTEHIDDISEPTRTSRAQQRAEIFLASAAPVLSQFFTRTMFWSFFNEAPAGKSTSRSGRALRQPLEGILRVSLPESSTSHVLHPRTRAARLLPLRGVRQPLSLGRHLDLEERLHRGCDRWDTCWTGAGASARTCCTCTCDDTATPSCPSHRKGTPRIPFHRPGRRPRGACPSHILQRRRSPGSSHDGVPSTQIFCFSTVTPYVPSSLHERRVRRLRLDPSRERRPSGLGKLRGPGPGPGPTVFAVLAALGRSRCTPRRTTSGCTFGEDRVSSFAGMADTSMGASATKVWPRPAAWCDEPEALDRREISAHPSFGCPVAARNTDAQHSTFASKVNFTMSRFGSPGRRGPPVACSSSG